MWRCEDVEMLAPAAVRGVEINSQYRNRIEEVFFENEFEPRRLKEHKEALRESVYFR